MPESLKEQKAITISEVRAIFQKIEQPSQFQIRTLEYANKFSKMEATRSTELVDRLVKQFEIDSIDAVQIANSMPSSMEELRPFFTASKKKIIVSSRLEELLRLLDQYRTS